MTYYTYIQTNYYTGKIEGEHTSFMIDVLHDNVPFEDYDQEHYLDYLSDLLDWQSVSIGSKNYEFVFEDEEEKKRFILEVEDSIEFYSNNDNWED